MIVKNGGAGLARCLGSVAGLVDRIVIGDTGSSDDTVAIARGYGAEVLAVPWREDFAEARNEVLSQARCNWILVLDSDEMLGPASPDALTAWMGNQAVWGYDVTRWNYVQELGLRSGGEQAIANPGTFAPASAYPACFPTRHTRLFRRDPRIRFRHCVHESVEDSMAAAGLARSSATFVIHHFGYTDDAEETRTAKEDLYMRLSYKKLGLSPGSSQAHLEAGMVELDYARSAGAALQHFLNATSLDPARYTGWLYRGICLTRLGRSNEALECLRKAASLNTGNPLVQSASGDAHFQLGSYNAARLCYEQAHRLGDSSALCWAKLGASEVQVGLGQPGLLKVQEAVAREPGSAELLGILASSALLLGQVEVACGAAARRLSMPRATAFDFVLAATLYGHAGDPSRAEGILREGLLLFPGDAELRAMIAK